MAKESYQNYQIWVLKALSDNQIYSTKEIREKVKSFFNYSQDELDESLPSGKNVIDDRITWANTYLHNAKAITRVKRGHYKITDRGVDLLEKYPDGLNDKILMQFPEFVDYLNKSHNKETSTNHSNNEHNFSRCLKEGNPIVEALGNAVQSIMIRTYKPSIYGRSFLLYPTSFYKSQNLGLTFDDEFHSFVEENIVPDENDGKIPIKYFVNVEYVIEDKNIPISYFNDFHIWSDMHIYDYLDDKPVYIWLLRVYKLKEPQYIDTLQGISYVNLKKEISLDNMKPVISDDDFKEIKEKLVLIEYNKLLNDKLDKILDYQEKLLKNL